MAEPTEAVAGRVTWADALWIALFFGLLAGAAEILVAFFKMLVLNRFVSLSRDLLWMSPLSAVMFVLVPGLVVAVLARYWRAVHIGWVVGTLAFVVMFALSLAVPIVATWAIALVAAGVAVRLGARARQAPNAWLRVARRGSVVLALAATMLGLGERVWRWTAERVAVARLAAAPPDAPNVLLIIFDTVRRDHLSLHGYERPTTPMLARRAPEGTVFDFAVSTAPWTLPSHASFFTGRYPDRATGDWRRPVDDGLRTLASALSERGFVTGGFVDNLLYTSYESGLDAGFAHFEDYPISLAVILRHFALGRSVIVSRLLDSRTLGDIYRAVRRLSFRKAREAADEPPNAERLTSQFLEWERGRGNRPFLAFINYFEAHGLFRPSAELERLFPGGKRVDWYDAAIAHIDRQVGRLLDTLQQRGVLDNTIVVITSDHGEQFGEHKLLGHANSLYLPLLRVPLLMRYPAGVPAGRFISEPVTLRDLPATILELAGLAKGSGIPGNPLTRMWREPSAPASPLLSALTRGINLGPVARNARGPLASLIEDGYHYIRGPDEAEELYAYESDSLEIDNVSESPAAERMLRHFRAALVEVAGITPPGTAPAPVANDRQ